MIQRTIVTAFLFFAHFTAGGAQEFPSRPIKVIVPFAAGGPTDVSARLLMTALSRSLNQNFTVENIGGAGGGIGTARAAAAEADGYTLLFNNVSLGASSFLNSGQTYDPITDFEPLGIATSSPGVLIARPDFPADNLNALVQHMKANGGNVTIANSGTGGTSHLCQVLLLNATGTSAISVAYRGSALAINDLATGQVDMLCDGPETAAPHIQAGRIKALGVTSLRRAVALPNVPTLDEQGLKGFDFTVWFALFAPKKTAPANLVRLSDALAAAVRDPSYREAVVKLGTDPVAPDLVGAAALKQILQRDVDRWGTLLRASSANQAR